MLAHAQEAPEPRELFRIGDVSRLTDTKPFVLRYWETEFPMLQPVKTPKGHRLYRQEDVELIRAIKRLLYEEGFTIAGARRHLTEILAGGHGLAAPAERAGTEAGVGAPGPALVISPRAAGEERGNVREDGQKDGEADPPAVPAALAAREFAASGVTASRDAFVHPEIRGTLLAVRAELRAILTLLQGR
jgi:hypothetical protein